MIILRNVPRHKVPSASQTIGLPSGASSCILVFLELYSIITRMIPRRLRLMITSALVEVPAVALLSEDTDAASRIDLCEELSAL